MPASEEIPPWPLADNLWCTKPVYQIFRVADDYMIEYRYLVELTVTSDNLFLRWPFETFLGDQRSLDFLLTSTKRYSSELFFKNGDLHDIFFNKKINLKLNYAKKNCVSRIWIRINFSQIGIARVDIKPNDHNDHQTNFFPAHFWFHFSAVHEFTCDCSDPLHKHDYSGFRLAE